MKKNLFILILILISFSANAAVTAFKGKSIVCDDFDVFVDTQTYGNAAIKFRFDVYEDRVDVVIVGYSKEWGFIALEAGNIAETCKIIKNAGLEDMLEFSCSDGQYRFRKYDNLKHKGIKGILYSKKYGVSKYGYELYYKGYSTILGKDKESYNYSCMPYDMRK